MKIIVRMLQSFRKILVNVCLKGKPMLDQQGLDFGFSFSEIIGIDFFGRFLLRFGFQSIAIHILSNQLFQKIPSVCV